MSPKILILRRENIGDLVCTTPLIAALRRHFPGARLDVLANSYNAPIVAHQPDLNAVYAYTKGKHAGSPFAVLRAHAQRLALLWRLRSTAYDDIVLADPTYVPRNLRLARFLKGGRTGTRVIGFSEGDATGIDFPVALDASEKINIVELVFRLGRAWGLEGPPPPLRLDAREHVARPLAKGDVVGLHISARLPSQRWPAARFAELARDLHQRHGVQFLLFWSPGAEDDARHPGDDAKAREVLSLCAGLSMQAAPTATLEELMAGLDRCQAVVCADGGAMHVAAGLGKPLVCLFGESDAVKWRPWGVACRVLQAESRQVSDLSVAQAAEAFAALQQELAKSSGAKFGAERGE